MANTYTQVYIQFIFAVQNRISLIKPEWESELYKYTTGMVQNKKHKMIAINGMPDHVHMFIGMHPTESMSDLMKVLKGETSQWISTKGFVRGNFRWQKGFGAFSYGRSKIDTVYKYIMNQKKHHRKKLFHEEYIEFLEKFDVDYDERYILKSVKY